MDHLASLMSFLAVILVVSPLILSPFTAEARPNKLVDQGKDHHPHHVKPPRPSTPTKAPPLTPPPPPPPQIHNDYWPPPALPTPPAPSPSPYYNSTAPPPPLPQPGDDTAATPAPPPPYTDYSPPYPWGAETPDWTPPGYFPKNGRGGFLCGEGPCWDSQYCNYPCAYCGGGEEGHRTCIVEPNDPYYDVPPQVPSSAPSPQP